MDPKNFYHRVYVPALQKAGLQKKSDHQTNSIEDKGQNVDWHTLRHTFASRLGMSGATEQDIAPAFAPADIFGQAIYPPEPRPFALGNREGFAVWPTTQPTTEK